MALTMAQIQELIERVELFHGISGHDVEKIFSHGMTMRVGAGEAVFYRGTVGNQMYVVLGGKLGVYGDGDVCLAELVTGDMFGEMALVTQEPRSATVKAINESFLFALSEDTFHKLMTKKAAVQLLLNMVTTLSKRLKQANARR
jgi:CRP-like cAMP-binding protein